MSYVIIGNSTAAVGAVEGIRKYDIETPIVIISDEPYHTYSRPLISYYLGGKVAEENMYYRSRDFYEKNKVKPILGIKAKSVDFDKKEVVLQDESKIQYSKLLIATGGKPFIPPLEGLDKKNVFNFIKFDDVKEIEKVAVKGSRAVVVGASFSGLKAVEALVQRGVNVTVIDIMDRIMPRVFDETASSIALKTLREHGVEVLLKTTVEKIIGGENAEGVILKDGRELPCNFIILAMGVRCNTDLVKDTKLKINRGIVVDDRMRTNIPDVYAAGDAAEGYNFIEGRNMEIAIIPNAYRQGETAGENMAGKERLFNKGFIMNSMPLLGLSIISAGLSESGEGIRVKAIYKNRENTYKKFYIRDKKLVGYLLINDIDRAGIYTDLIRREVDISLFEDRLGEEGFGFVSLPKEMRKERMLGG
ncbi:MAG: NAD(P)/FAD-dependent oxidoreductase [Firmicutes bacterium]|nr:NAD(P)/FAD-dependent oxidoreductase [Bacillota bacterium]